MRLEEAQITVLKNKVKSLNDKAKIYLFGSRVDDAKKGGDIDLLVVSNTLNKRDLRLIRIEFFKYFGEQKIDIVLDDGRFANPFHQHILQKAVLL